MKKQIAVTVLVITLFFYGITGYDTVKGTDSPYVSSEKTTVIAGEEVIIPVFIKNNPGIMGFTFFVGEASNTLKPIKVEAGELTPTGMLNDNIGTNEQEEIKVCWASDSEVQGDGTLFYITFAVPKEALGKYTIYLSYDENDTYNEVFGKVGLVCEDWIIEVVSQDGEVTETTSTMVLQEPMTLSGGLLEKKDNELTVPLLFRQNSGIMGYKITIHYDGTVLNPIDVRGSEKFEGSFVNNIGTHADDFSIMWTGTENVTDSGEIATITFEIIDTNAYKTSIDLTYDNNDTFDEQYHNVNIVCNRIEVELREYTGEETEKPSIPETTGREDTTKVEPSTVGKQPNIADEKYKKIKAKILHAKKIKKNKVQIKWKKIKGTTRYVIKYSSNKKFKKRVKTIIVKASHNKKLIRKLKSNKYYFKVRAYKIREKTKIYCKWSKVKVVRIKKK